MSTTHRDPHVEVRQYPDQDYLGTEIDAALAAVGESVAAAYTRIFAELAREHVQPVGPPSWSPRRRPATACTSWWGFRPQAP